MKHRRLNEYSRNGRKCLFCLIGFNYLNINYLDFRFLRLIKLDLIVCMTVLKEIIHFDNVSKS